MGGNPLGPLMIISIFSGESRISLDFPQRWDHQPLLWQNFPAKKRRKIRPRGWSTSLAPPTKLWFLQRNVPHSIKELYWNSSFPIDSANVFFVTLRNVSCLIGPGCFIPNKGLSFSSLSYTVHIAFSVFLQFREKANICANPFSCIPVKPYSVLFPFPFSQNQL